MNSIRVAVVVAVGLLITLWWSVLPPRAHPPLGGDLTEQQRLQCPSNSRLEHKLCVCNDGTTLVDGACIQVWSSTGVRADPAP